MIAINTPRIVISALKGGAGKTIVTLGIIGAWRRRGLEIVPFKKGPDYIDAGWMSQAAERSCYNLDPFLMPKETVLYSFHRRGQASDIAVVEGNRGLYDGVDQAGTCSTAELAKWLDAPVILVVDCTKVTRTAAAMVLGCLNFDPDLHIAGVILNHVARSRHEAIVTKTIEAYTGVKVMGVMPRMKGDPLPMRHLGVTPCEEHPEAVKALDKLSQIVSESVDLEALERVAKDAPSIKSPDFHASDSSVSRVKIQEARPRIGVLKDAAFQFYYPENLEALEAAGATVQFLNAMTDPFPTDLDGLYIGGGFPETQAVALSKNEAFRKGLLQAIEQGLPVYAECGGLMYLGEHIVWHDKAYPMVGAISWDFVLGRRPVGHGYSVIEVSSSRNPFFQKGTVLQGHEFHYSKPVPTKGQRPGELTCRVVRGHGFTGKQEGIVYKNLFGTYTHIHALERKDWGACLVRLAVEFQASKKDSEHAPVISNSPSPGKGGDKNNYEPCTKTEN